MDDEVNIDLLLVGKCKWYMPCEHERISKKPFFNISDYYLRPGRFLNPFFMFMDRFFVEEKESAIWHSSYYTLPRKWNGKIVMTVADMIHELFPELFCTYTEEKIRKQKKKCIERSDAVFCISHSCKNDLIELYGIEPSRLHVIHLAASDFFKPRENLADDLKQKLTRPYILYVGTRSHYKNIDVLYRAYRDWAGRNDYDLAVVGKALRKNELNLLQKYGISSNVKVLSGVSDENLAQLYSKAAVFVYPSLYEGFGIPLLEAKQCGCPVIASDIPTSREISGDAALFFDPKDHSQLIGRLDEITKKDVKEIMIEKGYERATHFSWQKTAEQTLENYNKLWNEMKN